MIAPRPLAHPKFRRVLVVGGGIAGIQASLDLAALGLPVTLVEVGPSLGGVMAQLDKTFPTNDCAMCILSPRLLEITRNPAIELVTSSRLVHLEGEAGNFRAILQRSPRYVDPARCTGCGECLRVCPVKIPDPYNLGLKETKAIHLPFPQAAPLSAYIQQEACRIFQGKKCGACVKICPAQAINLHEQPTNWAVEVGAVILALGAPPAPPSSYAASRHPNVVSNLEFERLLSATGPTLGKLRRPSDDRPPQRLAFIQCAGSRDLVQGVSYCSTVCCTASLKEAIIARELSDGELATTIFYMDLRASGKNFDRYLEQAQHHGVRLIRSRVTGIHPAAADNLDICFTDAQGRVKTETFDLAVLALGFRPAPDWPALAAPLGLALNAHHFFATSPLSRVQTTRPGLFLCGAAREPMDIAETVTLASAAAGAASQLLAGARRAVSQAAGMPEPDPAAAGDPRLGIFLCHCGSNIAGVLDLQALAPVLRQLPGVVHVEDKLFACSLESTKQVAAVITGKKLNRVIIAACTPRTHEPVFREVVRTAGLNPGYVIMANVREQCAWVHQSDKDAAQDKARHLIAMAVGQAARLTPIYPQSFAINPSALVLGGGIAGLSACLSLADQGFHCYLVERRPSLGGLTRHLHFTLEGQNPQTMLLDLESQVCGHPNITVFTRSALVRFQGHGGQFQSTVRLRTAAGVQDRHLQHGALIVATGGREVDPRGRFLYGIDNRVLTQLELEARLQDDTLTLPATARVVMVQCVGSREPEHPYCSRLCCSEAIKNAILVKNRWPLAEVTVLYRDIRAYGFLEDYYLQAKDLGVRFLPYATGRPPRVTAPRRGPLRLEVWDELLSREVQLPADRLILSTGLEPHPDSMPLSQLLGLQRSPEGFFLEAHQKLKPVETATEGIYLCGLAHSPRNLAETISQAQAAAAAAARLLYQQTIFSGELTARLHRERCRRCLSCLEICPVGAVHLDEDGKPAIYAHACRGCGVCAAQCPAGAIAMTRGTDAELAAQISGLLSS